MRGFTLDDVNRLWQEGKLFVEDIKDTLTAEELLEKCQKDVLTYVNAIREYVSAEWMPLIDKVWQSVVRDDVFARLLVMQKGRKRGQMNRYVVTNIVFHMAALDIYQCGNLLELHKKLEGVDEKNGIYKGAGRYCLKREQRLRIRELKDFVAGQK